MNMIEDRHAIERIVEIVRAEYARTMEFGMSPGPEDYRIAIEAWLRDGRRPSDPDDRAGTTIGDLRRPDGTPADAEVWPIFNGHRILTRRTCTHRHRNGRGECLSCDHGLNICGNCGAAEAELDKPCPSPEPAP
jgi:hypothetical protein